MVEGVRVSAQLARLRVLDGGGRVAVVGSGAAVVVGVLASSRLARLRARGGGCRGSVGKRSGSRWWRNAGQNGEERRVVVEVR